MRDHGEARRVQRLTRCLYGDNDDMRTGGAGINKFGVSALFEREIGGTESAERRGLVVNDRVSPVGSLVP